MSYPIDMKKALLLFFSIVLSCSVYGQKAKKTAPKSKVATAKKTALAKSDNLTAELLEKKDAHLFFTLAGKDTLFSKPVQKKDGTPAEVKIVPFTSGGAKLHLISWQQNKKIGDAKTKLENITESRSEVWDVAAKKMVFENTYTVNNITEVVWLDANKTASKTEEKIRRGGAECTLSAQGDIVLKNKSQESKLTYNAAQQKFVAKK